MSNGDFSVFIRLGSDYKNNYYEYEVPLDLTPHSTILYNTNNSADQEKVWPLNNTLNFKLETLTDLKLERNKLKRQGQGNISYQKVYSKNDPDNTRNKISIIGNPSLAEVKVIMIGVRNNTGDIKSGEVWVNELRMTDFDEKGGWAANANLNVALSDLGTVNVSGRMETPVLVRWISRWPNVGWMIIRNIVWRPRLSWVSCSLRKQRLAYLFTMLIRKRLQLLSMIR